MKAKLFLTLFAVLSFLLTAVPASAAPITVNGTVVDETGEPVIGATVMVKGTSVGASTDIDGKFSFTAEKGAKIIVTSVGYVSVEAKAQPEMKITLKEDQALLDEVVVIGYGQVKRRDVTTAISTIDKKDIQNRPMTTVGQALQGKAAGVQVVQGTGVPGAEPSIRIRGASSFNGENDPLYVVDGVVMSNIKYLSPNEIENMQVLKDASAAAIYGSRAANGVILITTKSADSEKAKVQLSASYGLTQVVNRMEVLNAKQYKELQDDIVGGVALPDNLTDQTDWFDETYRTGSTQNYQVAVSQRAKTMSYYISGGYTRDGGIIKSSFYQRYNFRVKVDGEIKKWLKIGANVQYSDAMSNAGGAMGTGANKGGVVLSVINTPTYAPIWDPENPGQYYNNFYGMNNYGSPAEDQARTENTRYRLHYFIATGDLLFTILPNLTLKSTYTLRRNNGHDTTFVDPVATQTGRTSHGTGSDLRNTNTQQMWDNVLNYNLEIKKHRLDVMLGTSWTDSDYRNSWIYGSCYRDASIGTLNAANKIAWDNTGTSVTEWGIMSFFGRLAYNFDSRYLVTANLRYDGSSRLKPGRRWKAFPSFSAAWRASEENFLKDVSWISDLKLRGGWGMAGNQAGIGEYAYLQRYSINRIEWFQAGNEYAVPSIVQSNLRTPDLTWETTTSTNIGVDFSIFNGRWQLNADWYYKKTTDMLMTVSLPAGSALASTIQRNEGTMTNTGFEFNIYSHNIQGEFSWATSLNMSFNRNRLDDLQLKKIYTAVNAPQSNEDIIRNEPGRPLSGFYGYIADGVDPETGDMIYRDLNGDGRISASDRTYIGDPNPDFTYGMTNTFSWKGFDLSIFIQGSYGNDIYNLSRHNTEGMFDGKNQTTKVLDRWRIPGQITDVPKASFTLRNSTYFVEDGSYLRLKNVTLSYNFSGKWMKKVGITRLQPYFTANNLLTWTKYSGMDPEVNQYGNAGSTQGVDYGTYPHCRSYVFGVNVEF